METAEDYSPGNHCRGSWLPKEKNIKTCVMTPMQKFKFFEKKKKKKCSCYKHLLEKPDHKAIKAAYKNASIILDAMLPIKKK